MVGAGAVARRHVATLSGFPDVRVVAVADVNAACAEELAAASGARPHTSFDAMLDHERLDALYVCVPPFAHGPPELAAIDAGLPLFVEKPVAIDMATARTIAAAARERGTITAVGYHWRYLDIAERVRDLLSVNPPKLVLGYWLDKTPPADWWLVRARSGGQIVEQATHVLDLLRFVAGEVDQVYDAHSTRSARAAFPGSDIADVTAATLRLENGAIGAIAATCLLSRKHRTGLDVFCDGMALSVDETGLLLSRAGQVESEPARTDAKTLVDRDFIDAVKGGENRIRAPYEEALLTQRLACKIAAAANERPSPRAVQPQTRVRPGTRPRPSGECARSLGVERPGQAAMFELPIGPTGDGTFRVDTLFTGLSAGTELTFFKGTNPMLHASWDPDLGVFDSGRPARGYPIETMGYMEVARVAEPGNPSVGAGARVAMAYGHKTAHMVDPRRDRFIVLPEDLDPLLGIYVAHMGPICANALLHAAAEFAGPDVRELGDGVRGREVIVVGAGVVGLLTALFAAHHGAAGVTVADAGPHRLRAARALGFEVVDERSEELWRVAKARHRHGAGDRGADVVFQCRARAQSLADALRSLRPQGAVIDLAFYTGGADALRLGEEFHHNGLTIRCAQIGRVPRGLAPAWNRDRLSVETIELLRARGDAIRREMITEVIPLSAAPQLLDELASRRREVIQTVFEVGS